MPRRPRKRPLNPRPLTFSPFARSAALVACINSAKQQINESEYLMDTPDKLKGNGHIKNTLEEASMQSESSDEEDFEGVVQADFAFFDPKPDDFHGVKILLQNYLDDKQWDLSGFVDLILEQTTVGTVVKIEGSEDDGIFSFVSALNLGRYKASNSENFHHDHKCITELMEYLLTICQEKDVINDLKLLLGERACDVGLLVSQHVMNLPPQLLPPLYDAVFDEVSWATEDEPTEDLRSSFEFKFYILISKLYKHKRTVTKSKPNGKENDTIYAKPEDEIFHKLSSWSFNFPLRKQLVSPDELKDYRPMGLVMAVGADKVSTFRSELKSLIDSPPDS
ncbi:hypothetical protein CDL15_Pgr006380 [Punica granatum]|uniref:Protein BCCIP homolog n=1 Tax=Punica granatum TaxID=22663 RepID=A0A218VV98_PUNGR|nr:hypothetical protein CDL15_Pgr006380 [Punica granatum]